MVGGKFPGETIRRRSFLARSFLVVSTGAIGLMGLGITGCTPRSGQSVGQSVGQRSGQAENSAGSQPENNPGSAVKGQSGQASGKTMTLSSAAFAADGMIPAKYTCDGENRSPALSWDAPPAGTKSLAVLASDPDAPGKTPENPFVHWVLYDLPPDLRQLPEGVPANPLLSAGGTHGKSDFGKFGYGGPCPPSGTHRYVFRLYALDKFLDLPPGASQAEVISAMEGHTLAEAEQIGRAHV